MHADCERDIIIYALLGINVSHLPHTVVQEIFMLKIICVKKIRVDKLFDPLNFLRKMFYSRVKFSRLVSTAKLF